MLRSFFLLLESRISYEFEKCSKKQHERRKTEIKTEKTELSQIYIYKKTKKIILKKEFNKQ